MLKIMTKKTFVLFGVVTFLLVVSSTLLSATHKKNYKPHAKTAKKNTNSEEKIKIKTHAPKSFVGSQVVRNKIDMSFGYDNDDKNFLSEGVGPLRAHDSATEGKIKSHVVVTQEPIVLVNVHGTDQLHLGEAISGRFTPGVHRSLSWACPYENAASAFKNQENVHDSLALPLQWSKGKYRGDVTFMVIPKGAVMEYKIGNAVDQKVTKNAHSMEYREGAGMQLRLKYIPEGTVLITKHLLDLDHRSMAEGKGQKSINLVNLFKDGIQEYNNNPSNEHKISPELAYLHHESVNIADQRAFLRKVEEVVEA